LKFRRVLRTVSWILLQHEMQQVDDRQRKVRNLVQGNGGREMLAHYVLTCSIKRHLRCEHLPESHSKRIDIGTNVRFITPALFRTRKVSGPKKHSRSRERRLKLRARGSFRQTKIDYLYGKILAFAEMNHEVGRFDIPMNDLFLMSGAECRIDLFDNFESRSDFEGSASPDIMLERFSCDKLHRIEVIVIFFSEIKNRRNIWLAYRGRSRSSA